MCQVPPGKVKTISETRAALARRQGASLGCPLTTGIFAWVAAHAAKENRATGAREVATHWCTLKAPPVLSDKYPGGTEHRKFLPDRKGLVIIGRGKNYGGVVFPLRQVLPKRGLRDRWSRREASSRGAPYWLEERAQPTRH
jgi:hypothetical protein